MEPRASTENCCAGLPGEEKPSHPIVISVVGSDLNVLDLSKHLVLLLLEGDPDVGQAVVTNLDQNNGRSQQSGPMTSTIKAEEKSVNFLTWQRVKARSF